MRLAAAAAWLALAGRPLAIPTGHETVPCRDGTFSRPGRGACAAHGGVARAPRARARGMSAEAAPGGAAAPGSVLCGDGTAQAEGPNACAGHGVLAMPKEGAASAEPVPDAAAVGDRRGPRGPPRTIPGARAEATEPSAPTRAPARDMEPAVPGAPAAAARCRDGSLWYRRQAGEACAGHDGVAQWLER